MFTVLFMMLVFAIFGKICWFGLKATWGITKLLVTLVFLPFTIIGFFLGGLVHIAIPLLVIFAIYSLVIGRA